MCQKNLVETIKHRPEIFRDAGDKDICHALASINAYLHDLPDVSISEFKITCTFFFF